MTSIVGLGIPRIKYKYTLPLVYSITKQLNTLTEIEGIGAGSVRLVRPHSLFEKVRP
jgi:hypothetical protein